MPRSDDVVANIEQFASRAALPAFMLPMEKHAIHGVREGLLCCLEARICSSLQMSAACWLWIAKRESKETCGPLLKRSQRSGEEFQRCTTKEAQDESGAGGGGFGQSQCGHEEAKPSDAVHGALT